MTLHIIKLCVGAESIEDLAQWQAKRIKEQKKRGVKKPQLMHITRMTPKRKDEVLDGGSLYWVIKGQIAVRQKLLDLKPTTKNGTPMATVSNSNTLMIGLEFPLGARLSAMAMGLCREPKSTAMVKAASGSPRTTQCRSHCRRGVYLAETW